MSWLDHWQLCFRRNCDPSTFLSRQEQEHVLVRLLSGSVDATHLRHLQSLVASERLGLQANRLSDRALLNELRSLLRSGRLHIHSRQRTFHRSDSYEAPLEDARPRPKRQAAAARRQVDWDTWVAIKLVDEDKQPVPGVRFRITLPDQSVKEGTLDKDGKARVNSFSPGECKICFPDLDAQDWHPL